jgi:sodium-dependent dicarboxylate transporter 2/3/5
VVFGDPRLGLAVCAVVGLVVGVGCLSLGLERTPATMAGLAALMATAWVTEVVPIPVTSLFPLALFPLFGVLDLKKVAASYGKPVIYLFLGGFLLALALQRSQLHRRVALLIINALGSRPSRLVLGFMVASAALSMWISNTASVLVMMPIGLAILQEVKDEGVDERAVAKLGTAIMLGIAYAADIGGMATPVGTPPNLVLLELYAQVAPDRPPIGFGTWMTMGLPISFLFLGGGWLLMTKVLFRFDGASLLEGSDAVRDATAQLGPVRRDEKIAGAVFGATALLWMTGADLQLGSLVVPGWRGALGLEGVGDASVAIAAAALLFAIPSRDHPGEMMLTWKQTSEVPWGLLLLFGGGFALAAGFGASGLSNAIGEAMGGLRGVHPILVVIIVCTVLTFLTEVTSNTATTTLVLPILAQAADAIGVDPLLLMIPATLSASCAFMMPVASPTQAIVFGSGYVGIRQMVRAGIGFNLLGIALVTLVFMVLAGPVFGLQW